MAERFVVPRKAGREHRVPLSNRAAEIVKGLFEFRTCDLVFPNPRGRKPLSHVAMANVGRRMKVDGATVHGFRSAFHDWAGNDRTLLANWQKPHWRTWLATRRSKRIGGATPWKSAR